MVGCQEFISRYYSTKYFRWGADSDFQRRVSQRIDSAVVFLSSTSSRTRTRAPLSKRAPAPCASGTPFPLSLSLPLSLPIPQKLSSFWSPATFRLRRRRRRRCVGWLCGHSPRPGPAGVERGGGPPPPPPRSPSGQSAVVAGLRRWRLRRRRSVRRRRRSATPRTASRAAVRRWARGKKASEGE